MMVDYIRKGFKERINQMDWLSDFSKQSSIEKLNAITAYSAYPVEIYDADYVNRLYSGVSKNSIAFIVQYATYCIYYHRLFLASMHTN